MPVINRVASLFVAALLVVAVAGCSSEPPRSTGDNNDEPASDAGTDNGDDGGDLDADGPDADVDESDADAGGPDADVDADDAGENGDPDLVDADSVTAGCWEFEEFPLEGRPQVDLTVDDGQPVVIATDDELAVLWTAEGDQQWRRTEVEPLSGGSVHDPGWGAVEIDADGIAHLLFGTSSAYYYSHNESGEFDTVEFRDEFPDSISEGVAVDNDGEVEFVVASHGWTEGGGGSGSYDAFIHRVRPGNPPEIEETLHDVIGTDSRFVSGLDAAYNPVNQRTYVSFSRMGSVYYVPFDAGEEELETVRSGNASRSSHGFADDGTPWVAYGDNDNGFNTTHLIAATRDDEGAWTEETVENDGHEIVRTAVGTGPDGDIHIVFRGIAHATRQGEDDWDITDLGENGRFTSLANGDDGSLHLAHVKGTFQDGHVLRVGQCQN